MGALGSTAFALRFTKHHQQALRASNQRTSSVPAQLLLARLTLAPAGCGQTPSSWLWYGEQRVLRAGGGGGGEQLRRATEQAADDTPLPRPPALAAPSCCHATPSTAAALARSCTAAGAWAISQLATKLLGRPNPQERLLDAAKQGSVAGVTRALAAGAPVDRRDPATRETPLIKAAGGRRAGHTEVLQALLAAGACPHYTDAAGNAALHRAAASGSEGHVAALLEAGAAIDQPNYEGLAPLELAF